MVFAGGLCPAALRRWLLVGTVSPPLAFAFATFVAFPFFVTIVSNFGEIFHHRFALVERFICIGTKFHAHLAIVVPDLHPAVAKLLNVLHVLTTFADKMASQTEGWVIDHVIKDP